jgi:micrococcal nuclease
MYTYKAKINRVVDGDTVNLTIDLGFRLNYTCNCRLAGINAPEMSTDEGKKSKMVLDMIIPKNWDLIIHSTGLDKYGRPIVIIDHFDPTEGTFNEWMVVNGYAVKYMK